MRAGMTAMVLPAMLQGGWEWSMISWWHFLALSWVVYALYFLGPHLSIPPHKRLGASVGLIFGAVKDVTVETYTKMEGAKVAFDQAADFLNSGVFKNAKDPEGKPVRVSGYQVFLVFVGLLILGGLALSFRREIKKKYDEYFPETRPNSADNTPPSSPTVGPLRAPDGDDSDNNDGGSGGLSPRSATYDQFTRMMEKFDERMEVMNKKIDGHHKEAQHNQQSSQTVAAGSGKLESSPERTVGWPGKEAGSAGVYSAGGCRARAGGQGR